MIGKATPVKGKLLVKDTDREVAHGDFSYSSVVGIMPHVSGHSRTDIAYAINCAACCLFCPRHFYRFALRLEST